MFVGLLSVCTRGIFGESLVSYSEGYMEYASLSNNQSCHARPTLVNINFNETLFYLFAVNVNKYGGNCDTIVHPYARVCVPNKVKNMNVKLLYLMSGVNETKFLVRHESCKCKYRLNEFVFNSKQKRNHDKCWCYCKKIDDWGSCKNY